MNIGKYYVLDPDNPNTPLIKPVGLIPKGARRCARWAAPAEPGCLGGMAGWRAGMAGCAARRAEASRRRRWQRAANLPAAPAAAAAGLPPAAAAAGLPPVTISWWFPLYETGKMITLALLICLVDVCESVSIAKALAQRNHYRLDGTQELRGLGLANIVGAMFNCYTTTGSFSRSAVNNSVGAKTPLAQMITGFTVMLVLLVLTPVFENMSANVQVGGGQGWGSAGQQ